MPRKFGNEIRLPGTTGIDNLPIPLTLTGRVSRNRDTRDPYP